MADYGDGLEKLFNLAAEYVKTNAASFDTQSLLNLYSRFKQAKEGPCNTPKPGFFDFQGKQKWEAWRKLGNMEKTTAMSEYVKEVASLDTEWQDKVQKDRGEKQPVKSQKDGLGVAVSVMVNEDTVIDDELKTVFDWCKEGNLKRVSTLLDSYPDVVDTTDDEGMVLLHWACDRGFTDMVKLLLSKGASINIQDADGQTPLHFAVTCEHCDVVRALVTHGADKMIEDFDGSSPVQLATSSEIKQLLENSSADDKYSQKFNAQEVS